MVKNKALKIIATITLIYFIIITSVYLVEYSDSFYDNQFETNGVYEKLGREETKQIHSDFQEYYHKDYFGYDRYHLLEPFTEAEQSHIKDFKVLYDWVCILYYFSILLLLSIFGYYANNYPKEIKEFGRSVLLYSGSASLGIIVLLGLSSLLDFSFAFTAFHQIFFPQGNWMFPYDSLLITLFPLEFFISFFKRIIIYTVIISLIPLIVSLVQKHQHSQ